MEYRTSKFYFAYNLTTIAECFSKPAATSNVSFSIAGAVRALEDNQESLGYSHFSVECDTIERVFLDMCANADGGQTYAKPKSLESLNSLKSTSKRIIKVLYKTQSFEYSKMVPTISREVSYKFLFYKLVQPNINFSVALTIPTDDVELIADGPIEPHSYFRQGKALLKKRLWHFSRDWRAPLATLILPTLFVAVAMGFSLIRPPSDDQPPLVLTTDLYNTHPVYFYRFVEKSALILSGHYLITPLPTPITHVQLNTCVVSASTVNGISFTGAFHSSSTIVSATIMRGPGKLHRMYGFSYDIYFLFFSFSSFFSYTGEWFNFTEILSFEIIISGHWNLRLS